jgi:hypothetical protein
MTVYVRQRRSLPKRASSKATVLEGRRGASKSDFRARVVPTDVRKSHLEALAKSVAAVPMAEKDARKLARKKRVGAGLSAAGGVAGITGLGLMAAKKPKAALWASTIGGGIGGTNALLQGPIQRAEASALDPRRLYRRKQQEGVVKSMPGTLSVPRGLRTRKTYTASSVRTTTTGRLVRTRAGVR